MSQDPPILMPDGSPYINTTRCAATLYDGGRDARHLGLIDVDDLIDRKNPEPTIYLREAESGEIGCQGGLGDLIEPTFEIPRLTLIAPVIAQPYQIEIWCEKSTMNDILMPLGERYGVNVITGTGELSLNPLRPIGATCRRERIAGADPLRVRFRPGRCFNASGGRPQDRAHALSRTAI